METSGPRLHCLQVQAATVRLVDNMSAARAARGLKPRGVRACVVGFPNVGKSAIINRLLGRRRADSAPKPGVTRNLRWLRLGGVLDLLDSPGRPGSLHASAPFSRKPSTQECLRPWTSSGLYLEAST